MNIYNVTFILLIGIFTLNLNNYTVIKISPERQDKCKMPAFRFIELSENGWESNGSRQVEVFLEGEAFSENNLEILFTFLSEKYRTTRRLVVKVSTDWEQLDFSANCEVSGRSSQDVKPNFKYRSAYYLRDEKIEYFRFYPFSGKDIFELRVIKGKFPAQTNNEKLE